MAEIKDKLVIAESLKNVYDTLNNDLRQLSEEIANKTGTGLSTEAIDKLEEVGNYLAYTTADGGSKWTELISILRNGSSGGGSSETVPATGITLDKTTLSFTDSTSQTLVATVEPSDTTDKVVWTSSAESVATVTNGVVKPLSNGSATITATCGSVSATCSVTVDIAEEEPVTLTSISASYSGGDVAVGTSLNDLTGITVTAHYSDGSTANVTDYTLSGEIVEGENTITVSYGGMTTTFTVTGVAESSGEDKPSTTLLVTNAAITTAGALDVWTDGYIDDNGEVKTSIGAYFYDEYIEAAGFAFLNSSDALVKGELRIAEYDDNKTFISRKRATTAECVFGDNSPSFIKCGFGGNIYRSTIHTIIPLIQVSNICTVENVTIDTTGAAVAFNGRNATEYIPITGDIGIFYMIAISVSAIVAFYDIDYALVDRISFGGGGSQLITVPADAAYIRICIGGAAVYTSLKFTA